MRVFRYIFTHTRRHTCVKLSPNLMIFGEVFPNSSLKMNLKNTVIFVLIGQNGSHWNLFTLTLSPPCRTPSTLWFYRRSLSDVLPACHLFFQTEFTFFFICTYVYKLYNLVVKGLSHNLFLSTADGNLNLVTLHLLSSRLN